MTDIKAKLALTASSDDRMHLLETAAETLRQQKAKTTDVAKQTEISRAICRLTKASAYECYGNKDAWAKRWHASETL